MFGSSPQHLGVILVAAGAMTVGVAIQSPLDSLAGLGILVIGFPVYQRVRPLGS